MKVSVNWLRDFVKTQTSAERVAEALTMSGLEVKSVEKLPAFRDVLFETEVTTNRPDWLSHIGVAREIAAVQGLKCRMPERKRSDRRSPQSGWKLQLNDPKGCPYYTGVLIQGIQSAATPVFIKNRLAACGIRSINLLADITNYVLMETGQPLHAFDADRLQGKQIAIRRASKGERLRLIDESELKLQADDLVIADAEEAVALAGVMGGKGSEVSAGTRNIFLESAFFLPGQVRRMSRRYALTSESSYRFERRVDPEGVDFARERALFLIQKYAKPHSISQVVRIGKKPQLAKANISFSPELIKKHIGFTIPVTTAKGILSRLGLTIKSLKNQPWQVKIPSFRFDLERPVDLVEEIARIYGFDRIPETLPDCPSVKHSGTAEDASEWRTRDFMTSAGFNEIITFSLIPDQGLTSKDLATAVTIVNPQNKMLRWMRPVMYPSHLDIVKRNQHWGMSQMKLFEIANVYRKTSSKKSQEEKVLALTVSGEWRAKTWLDSDRGATFYDVKGVLMEWLAVQGVSDQLKFQKSERPYLDSTVSRDIFYQGKNVGYLGKVHQDFLKIWDLEKETFIALLQLVPFTGAHKKTQVKPLDRFPFIQRDISLTLAESGQAGEILSHIENIRSPLIRSVEVFDFFQGGHLPKGYKNVGFRITYSSEEQTLRSEEVQAIHEKIDASVRKQFQAVLPKS